MLGQEPRTRSILPFSLPHTFATIVALVPYWFGCLGEVGANGWVLIRFEIIRFRSFLPS